MNVKAEIFILTRSKTTPYGKHKKTTIFVPRIIYMRNTLKIRIK